MQTLSHWKEISNYLGVPVGTIRHWHYNVLPLPYRKSVPRRSGRVIVEKEVARGWKEAVFFCEGKVILPRPILSTSPTYIKY